MTAPNSAGTLLSALVLHQERALALARGGEETRRRAGQLAGKRRSSNTRERTRARGSASRRGPWSRGAPALPAAFEIVALAAIAMRRRDAGFTPPTEAAEGSAIRRKPFSAVRLACRNRASRRSSPGYSSPGFGSRSGLLD